MPGQAITSSSLVCSLDLPVCQHRSVLCPLGVPTHAINECYDASLKANSSAKEYERTPNSLLPQESDYSPSVPAL